MSYLILTTYCFKMGFSGGPDSKEPACNAGDPGNIPWRREKQATPVFLSGEFHGQKSLAGYSPWDHRVAQRCQTTTSYLTDEGTDTQSVKYHAQGHTFSKGWSPDPSRSV